jgi:CelD/BcsL family acetyltransferase involved in cellulose biosynthesis
MHAPSTDEEFNRLWEAALRLEAAGWKRANRSALLVDSRMRLFYEMFARRLIHARTLRIAFMKVDNTPVATQIAIETDNRYWLLKIGYDERYSKCSPGNLLLEWTLRDAARRKLACYEFLGSRERWTDRWTKQSREMVSIRTFPFTVRGLLHLARFGVETVRRHAEARFRGTER